ncbi:MAG: ribbon-helix-helix domain-containing protein [Candidatus Paracaedibacteraceae bacterium]|nr:ribbon-helix-helix domain-containing protein [Candidatus Paracaedibacteraceae bacterium]
MTGIVKKSVDLFGHQTSVSMEAEFWDTLKSIASEQNKSIRQIILDVDTKRLQEGSTYNLSGSLRVFILNYVLARTL